MQAARRRDLTLFELAWSRLTLRTNALVVENVDAGLNWGAVVPPAVSALRRSSVSPAILADALLRLAQGQPAEGVAVLLDVQVQQVQQFLDRLLHWLQNTSRSLHPRKFQRVHDADLASLLAMVGADMDRMFGDRLPPLRELLSGEVDRQAMANAVEGWTKCGRGEHIALGQGLPARGILRLLRSGGLAPAAVRLVRQSVDPSSGGAMQPDLHSAVCLYQEEFGFQPIVETRSPRVDRPSVYLLISSQPKAPQTPSAASCNAVLKAWLVACQAYLLFTSNTHQHDELP